MKKVYERQLKFIENLADEVRSLESDSYDAMGEESFILKELLESLIGYQFELIMKIENEEK